MPTFYVDESGFTGEDLLAEDQPLFVQATTIFTAAEAKALLAQHFAEFAGSELKHSRLARRPAHQARVIALVDHLRKQPERFATWVAHKEYAALTLVVDWWIEPFAHRQGFNLYKDGGNQALSNMLFICLQGFWDEKFRRRVLLSFQRMFRAKTRERFVECERLVAKASKEASLDEKRSEILQYLLSPFEELGLNHVQGLPAHVFDIALPGLVELGHQWRARHGGPWEVVHDQSSSMAKSKWLWDKLTTPEFAPAEFPGPHGSSIFPMNVASTRFANSAEEPSIQLCDLIAGASTVAFRSPRSEYGQALWDAGIRDFAVNSIWPSDAVTPEALGTKGWDGNEAIEWISKELAKATNPSA